MKPYMMELATRATAHVGKLPSRVLVVSACMVLGVCDHLAAQTAQTPTLLYSFQKEAGDAAYPKSGVIKDASGNLYGTEAGGGKGYHHLFGTVYKIAPPSPGQTAPVETIIHTFSGPDGDGPEAGLVIDKSGNLFGTTVAGVLAAVALHSN